jgi:hypothetical protein
LFGEKPKLKFIVSLIIPLLVGAGIEYQKLSAISPEAILESGAIIFAAAQSVYQLYFKNSEVQRKIAK